MAFVYHMKPFDMRGEVLHPLNALKDRYPDVYEKQIAKYGDDPGRKKLPQRRIPKLDCLWNNVIQCAPIHPHHIYRAITERGLQLPERIAFYKIPVAKFAHLPTVIYYSQMKQSVVETLPDDAIEWFDFDTYAELTELPDDALAWYDELQRKGTAFGHFVGIPHVLIQGPIDIGDVEVIYWHGWQT
jgi:hypothetical protein